VPWASEGLSVCYCSIFFPLRGLRTAVPEEDVEPDEDSLDALDDPLN
jgi:hypothetical protein